jgi:hypothetical protein
VFLLPSAIGAIQQDPVRRIFKQASLDLQFAAKKSLVDATTGASLVTFTRASSGTYVGSDGLLQTAAVDTPRFDHNPTTGESLGLLVEEARTNLSLYSEDFSNAYWTKTDCTITANDSTAPDGTTTADLWTNILSAGGAINNSITKDATTRTYTVTMWVKGTVSLFTFTLDFGGTANRGRAQFNLAANTVIGITNTGNFTGTSASITAYPGGWARLTMTTTTSTGTTIRFRPFFGTGGESVYIWGAQVEEGAFATSYIPTVAATVTRAADVASITGSNFSGWYNQTEGTVFADAKVTTVAPVTSLTSVFALSDGTTNNRITVYKRANADTSTRLDVSTSGSSVAFINAGTFSVSNLIAASYRVDDFAISLNGLTPGTDTLGAVPTISRLNIGSYADLTFPLNGTIKRLTYWGAKLPNLQAITQP